MRVFKKIYKIYILAFVFSMHIAISAYVNSTFLENNVGMQYVGILYTSGALLTLLLLSNTSVILKYFGNRRLVMIFALANILALATFILSQNPLYIAIAFVVFTATNTLVLFCTDIFIEHFGTPKTIGHTRGIYLTVINGAWLFAPIISGKIIDMTKDYTSVYMVSFFMMAIMILGLLISIKTFRDKKYTKTPFLKIYGFLKKNHHIGAITFINFMLQFFFSLMVVYTPIYLTQHMGLSWGNVGIIFTIMLLPFTLFSIPIGKLIDKYNVKKRMLLYIGITIIGLSTMAISGIYTQSIIIWATILFITRTGAAIIETTSEIYFFTHVREEDAYLLSAFRDMAPVSYIVGPLLGSIFIMFLPFKYIFLALGIFMFFGFYYVKRLKHNHHAIGIPDQNK